MAIKRVASVIGIKPEDLAEYVRIHAAVWPGVLARLKASHIQNYSIYHREGMLFSYFEYTGTDYEADMAKVGADPITQDWWKVTEPLQQPLPDRQEGAWWTTIEEVFHLD